MKRIMALSEEKKMFDNVLLKIKKDNYLELKIFSDSLNLIDDFVTHHTELVILDLDLLNEKIIKLINTLKTIKKNVQIILILSKDKMPICTKALSLGVLTYFLKPISPTNMSNLILSALKTKNITN